MAHNEKDNEVTINKYKKRMNNLQRINENSQTIIKSLRTMLDDVMLEVEKIKTNLKSGQENFNLISSFMKDYENKEKNGNFTYKTQTQTNFTITEEFNTKNLKSPEKEKSISVSIKKLEDLEIAYIEMMRSFGLLTLKYKIVKEENNTLFDIKEALAEELKQVNQKYKTSCEELKIYLNETQRLKEINKCIVSISLANFSQNELVNFNVLNNIDNSIDKKEIKLDDDIENNEKYSEPMPSFFKFISN